MRGAGQGQPNEEQLADAARQGCKVVINLCSSWWRALFAARRSGTVRELGMRYVHIPVQFKAPSEEDLLLFCRGDGQPCRRQNARALRRELSCHRVYWPLSSRSAAMGSRRRLSSRCSRVSEPDEIWKNFSSEMLTQHSRPKW